MHEQWFLSHKKAETREKKEKKNAEHKTQTQIIPIQTLTHSPFEKKKKNCLLFIRKEYTDSSKKKPPFLAF